MVETTKKTVGEILSEDVLTLPIGFVDEEGKIHREIELREMTGEADEAIADPKIANNGGKIITELILAVTERLGTLPRLKKEQVRAMYQADRDFIVLMNYIKSVATDQFIRWDSVCSSCRSPFEVEVDYTKLNVYYLNDGQPHIHTIELPHGIRKGGGLYKKIKVRFMDGNVQEKLASAVNANTGEAVTLLLAQITQNIEGLESYSFDTFREMVKKDRVAVAKWTQDLKVGPEMMIDATCPNCGRQQQKGIPLLALLGEI